MKFLINLSPEGAACREIFWSVIAPLQGANSLDAGSRGGVLRHFHPSGDAPPGAPDLPLAVTFRAFGAVRSTLARYLRVTLEES
jgi:hypothetical protein